MHGDVGVRFGGSEHQRVSGPLPRTPVPRPMGQGLPATWSMAGGASRGTARQVPPGQGRPASSEGGRHRSTGVRQAALFGAPGVEPHRGKANGGFRIIARRASPGQGTRGSSEPGAPHPTGQGTGSPSGPTAPHPTGQEDRASSEVRHSRSTPARVPRL